MYRVYSSILSISISIYLLLEGVDQGSNLVKTMGGGVGKH
jgi:hypothetical protein